MIERAVIEAVKHYPEIREHLTGSAAWIIGVHEFKQGEAPDDDQRRKDERRIQRTMQEFFAGQLERIMEAVEANRA